jgi:hypothetical protein
LTIFQTLPFFTILPILHIKHIVKKLLIQLPSTFANRSLRLTRLSWFEANKAIKNSDVVEAMVKVGPKAQIDLQTTLSEVSFIDALDNESLPLRRNYQIIIEANDPSLDWSKHLVRNKIEVEFLNIVTGKISIKNPLRIYKRFTTWVGSKKF